MGSRAESRAIGSRAGNTFSVATFSAGDVDAENFWEEALPDAVRAARDGAANADPWDIDERQGALHLQESTASSQLNLNRRCVPL